MPTPNPKESESDFVGRCIPVVLKDGTAKDQKQAAAICYSIFTEHKKKADASAEADMAYQLNKRASESLKALIDAGKYNVNAWSFSADDANALLGDQNWTEYGRWFLGHDDTIAADSKDHYAYAFGKGGEVYSAALKTIAATAAKAGDNAVAKVAQDALDEITKRTKDAAKASLAPIQVEYFKDGKPVAFVSSDITITAEAPSEGKPKVPTFNMTAYTGGPMNLRGWKFPVVVDLQGMTGIDRSRPALRDHDQTQIVGHTTSINVENGNLTAAGTFSGKGNCAYEVMASGLDGFPWQASIGARVTKSEFVPEGKSAQANGKSFDGPVNIARQTVLGEISFVALGADDNTSARIAATQAGKGSQMETFEKWLEAKGFVLAELKDQQKTYFQAQFDAEQKSAKDKAGKVTATATKDGDDDDDQAVDLTAQRKAHADEMRRIAKIDQIAVKHPDIAAKAVEEGWTIEKTELEVLRARGPQRGDGLQVNTGAGKRQITAEALPMIVAAAAAKSGGLSEKVAFEGLTDDGKMIAASREYRGIGLHQIMRLVASSNGLSVHQDPKSDDFIRAILQHEQTIQAHGAGFSTMSLSGITENILNKAMLEAYGSVPSVVPDIAYETDTPDFKQFKRYRLTAAGSMKEIGNTGTLENMSFQDESYANQVKTQGCILVVTRAILVNDDMGALTQMPTIIGRQAAISREKAVISALLNNASSFFGSGNKNYLNSTGSALSITSLTKATQQFLEMKDANGDPIMVVPDRLLVPPALYATAQNLFSGANLVVTALGSTSAAAVSPNLNQHAGKYRPIVSPFLGDQSPLDPLYETNCVDTAWYQLGNPSGGMAVVQVGYLRGQRVPVIERGEPNFNVLGIAMRSWYDFGVALHDFRCGQFSLGDG
jgi:hypothetical protein